MSQYLLRNLSSTRYSNANTCLYDLAAVIVHHGNGMGSGEQMMEFLDVVAPFVILYSIYRPFWYCHWFQFCFRPLHSICNQQPGLVQFQWLQCQGGRLSDSNELQGLHLVLCSEGFQQNIKYLHYSYRVTKESCLLYSWYIRSNMQA